MSALRPRSRSIHAERHSAWWTAAQQESRAARSCGTNGEVQMWHSAALWAVVDSSGLLVVPLTVCSGDDGGGIEVVELTRKMEMEGYFIFERVGAKGEPVTGRPECGLHASTVKKELIRA